MKRLFLAALATLLIAALLAAAISSDSGYVLIAFGSYTIETTVWIGLALLLAVLVLMYLTVALLHLTLRQGSRLSHWQRDRSTRRGRLQTTRGIQSLHEGQFARARHLLDRAAEKSDLPYLNYLLCARASAALGDREQVQLYLQRAARSTRSDNLAVALTQAELDIRQGNHAAAAETLQRVRRNARRNPLLLRLLQSAWAGAGAWEELIGLLPDLRRYHVLEEGDADALEARAALGLLATGDNPGADTLRARWQQLPKSAQRRPEALVAYAQALARTGAADSAEQLLRAQLKRVWNDAMVELYGRLPSENPERQLAAAESWLTDHAGDATLLRCLGRLALRNHLWGKARDYFEASLRSEHHPDTSAELGRLLAHLGQRERSAECFEQGLRASTGELPALPLPSPSANH
jgi:HemY protein